MAENAKEKTVFIMPHGLFQFDGMLFDLNEALHIPTTYGLVSVPDPFISTLNMWHHQHANKMDLMTCLCIPCSIARMSALTNNFIMRFYNNHIYHQDCKIFRSD